jgi:hypothetical protein
VLKILFQPLLLWQSPPSLNLFTFLFAGNLGLRISFDSCKFPKPPSIELARRVDTVCVINIDNFFFFFLCRSVNMAYLLLEQSSYVLSRSSRRMLSATKS